MDFTFRFNPVSAGIFVLVGLGVYLYAKDNPTVLSRWFSRTPISLALFCSVLPFPFLFVFLWDASRQRGRGERDGEGRNGKSS